MAKYGMAESIFVEKFQQKQALRLPPDVRNKMYFMSRIYQNH